MAHQLRIKPREKLCEVYQELNHHFDIGRKMADNKIEFDAVARNMKTKRKKLKRISEIRRRRTKKLNEVRNCLKVKKLLKCFNIIYCYPFKQCKRLLQLIIG